MDLFYLPVSPFSNKVQMALLEKGVPFAGNVVRPLIPQERDAYREIYPLGKLPLLRNGKDFVPESSVIIEYLESFGMGQTLIPQGGDDAREVRLLDRLADNYLSTPAVVLFFQSLRPESEQDKERMKTCIFQIDTTYANLEARLALRFGEEFIVGEHLTMADLSLIAALRITHNFVPIDSYKVLSHYFDKLSQRDSYQMVDAEARVTMDQLMEALAV